MKRFTRTTCLLLLSFTIGISTLDASGHWSGEVTREIAVRVLTAESAEPIVKASVRLSDPSHSGYPHGTDKQPVIEAITDDSGWATVKAFFHASGTSGLGGGWWMRGWLEVEQEEYQKAADWLVNFAGIEDAKRVDGAKPEWERSLPMTSERIEIVVAMKRKGADVDLQDVSTLLSAAWSEQDAEKISALLNAGIDVNARDKDGWTALMYAARYNQRTEIISVLLNAGADVNAQNKDGRTALWLAVSRPIVASFQDVLSFAQPIVATPEVVSLLLGAAAEVNVQDKDGQTALWGAAASQDSVVVSLLLEAGADVNAKDEFFGKTVLMQAANYSKYPEVISLLMNAGADAKLKSREGKTAFDYAQHNTGLKDTEAYKQLSEAQ